MAALIYRIATGDVKNEREGMYANYGNTLYLASRRDVMAELLFQAVSKPPMVVYTPAFGYQPCGMTTGSNGIGSLVGGGTSKTINPTLGEHISGLAMNNTGVLIGNQQTGETGSIMGYAGKSSVDANGVESTNKNVPYSAYAWKGSQLDAGAAPAVVYADNSNMLANVAASVELGEAAVDAGFPLNSATAPTAVFNNSFGKFGLETYVGAGIDGASSSRLSSVKLYKLISNGEINGHHPARLRDGYPHHRNQPPHRLH